MTQQHATKQYDDETARNEAAFVRTAKRQKKHNEKTAREESAHGKTEKPQNRTAKNDHATVQ